MAQDVKAVSRAILSAFGIVAMLAIPAGAGICAVAPYLVPVVLGQKWIAGVPVMEVLSINSAIAVFHATTATALIAMGNPFAATRVNMVFVAVMIPGVLILAHKFGPIGAAYAVFLACLTCTPIYLWQLHRHAGVGYKDWIRAVMRPVLASALMVAVVRLVTPPYALGMSNGHAGLVLAGDVAVGAVTYLASMLALWALMGRPDGAERQVLSRVQSRVPAWMPIPGR
jgi:O-antigen/teichoic acid export membrane protein